MVGEKVVPFRKLGGLGMFGGVCCRTLWLVRFSVYPGNFAAGRQDTDAPRWLSIR